MDARVIAGSIAAYIYNDCISRVPSRRIRECALRCWLRRLGSGTGVQMGCRFLNGRKISLGDRNVINFGSVLDGRRFSITVGNDVSVGPEAVILTLGHDPHSFGFDVLGGDVVIGERAWIGYRAIILPGVVVGDGAVVGAGAVVTKNLEPYSIVAGNPARVIRERSRNLVYSLTFRPLLQ